MVNMQPSSHSFWHPTKTLLAIGSFAASARRRLIGLLLLMMLAA
jgi:hypothetical protein